MVSLLIWIAVVGVIVWLVTTYVPMEATLKKVFIAVAVIIVVLYVLSAFGVLSGADVPVPQLR